jgi:hypothetical protein
MNSQKRNRLLFIVDYGSHWIGGVYYLRNFLNTILENQEFHNTEIIVLCPKEHLTEFADFNEFSNVSVVVRKPVFRVLNKGFSKVLRPFKRELMIDVLLLKFFRNIFRIYPVIGFPLLGLQRNSVYWIPDFQHKLLPQFFSAQAILLRDKVFVEMANANANIVVSSQDALNHFNHYYPDSKSKAHCVRFNSRIEPGVLNLDALNWEEEFKKFGLMKGDKICRYAYIANQFWKHKNHLFVFRAFSEFINNSPSSDLLLLCTGKTFDDRFPGYFEIVQKQLNDLGIQDRVRILNFVHRPFQIAILRNSQCLIQPSKFEGWGTGVQEAKRLGKPVWMSDIAIHREQADENSKLFNPDKTSDLVQLFESLTVEEPVLLDDQVLEARQKESSRRYAENAHLVFSLSSNSRFSISN